MSEPETQFDKFWQASSLDRFNVQEFAGQLNVYDSDTKELSLDFPAAAQALPTVRTPLNPIAKKRMSDRTFSQKTMTFKQLSRLLSSFQAWNGLEHRAYASAGATYVTEIFCMGFNVQTLTGKVAYYNPQDHSITVVSHNAPAWPEASESLNMNIQGVPQLLVAFVMFPERVMTKYGERGGRFALLEVGAAMQQLSLQIAASKCLKGVAVGGTLDNTWKDYLGLKNTTALVALAYLVGL